MPHCVHCLYLYPRIPCLGQDCMTGVYVVVSSSVGLNEQLPLIDYERHNCYVGSLLQLPWLPYGLPLAYLGLTCGLPMAYLGVFLVILWFMLAVLSVVVWQLLSSFCCWLLYLFY